MSLQILNWSVLPQGVNKPPVPVSSVIAQLPHTIMVLPLQIPAGLDIHDGAPKNCVACQMLLEGS